MENVKTAKNSLDSKVFCHDCGKKMEVKNFELKNGVFLAYDYCGEKLRVFKCDECFKKSKSLKNFRECEVYSRVVGYLRPVEQWNLGKKQEFKEREEYQFA